MGKRLTNEVMYMHICIVHGQTAVQGNGTVWTGQGQ